MMPRSPAVKTGIVCVALWWAAAPGAAATFVRGDVNQSGKIDLSDAVAVLMHLFGGAPVAGDCLDAADMNDSGFVDVGDAIYGLGYLFAQQAAPPAPFPACGLDPTEDGLGCESFALVPVLRALGMRDAFTPFAADLSGIDGTRELYVTDILHKAYVAVNEAGTEAAAATAVIVGIVSVPEPVTIDRPFLFFIRDIPTGAVLFGGRVVDPRA